MIRKILLSLLLLSPVFGYGQVIFGKNVVVQPGVLTGAGAGFGFPEATGDSRTVTEPTFPTSICSQVQATKYILQTNTINIDPYNATCGSISGTYGTLGCRGGTDYQPSQTSPTFAIGDVDDNTTASGGAGVQTQLNSCTPGQAVELVQGPGGQRGFVLAPWSLPSGVSLIVDAGIHVYMSRKLSDYTGGNCGLVASSSSCQPWVTVASGSLNSGIYGYGVFEGRGWASYTTSPTTGWYTNRIQAYWNAKGSNPGHDYPLTTVTTGNNSFAPTMFNLVGANNFKMYKVTLKDSGDFGIQYKQGTGGTFWDVKIFNPHEVLNTDGIDPVDATDVSIINSFISNGDNQIAIKAPDSLTSNISVIGLQTGAGIGTLVGSDVTFGVSNVLITGLTQNGNSYNDLSEGIGIGSNTAVGGLVNQITFKNVCMMNEPKSFRFFTNYNGSTGSQTPIYQNILARNIHVLASTAPYTTGHSGTFTFQGLNSSNPLQIQLDNITIDGINDGIQSQGGLTQDQYTTYYLGPGAVDSSITGQFTAGISNTPVGSAGSSVPYSCSLSNWQPLVGELNLYTSAVHNRQSYNGAAPYTLQAIIEPTTAVDNREYNQYLPDGSIQFYDNGVLLATASLTGAQDLAEYVVSSASSGTHTYTAKLHSDSHYADYTFGSVVVIVP